MRKPEFILGPWESFKYRNGGQKGLYVKQVGDKGLFLVRHTFDGIIAEANVKLMAAAPDMYEVLKLYEEFESILLMDTEAWGTEDGLPKFTQQLLDKWIEIQGKRNECLAKTEGEITNG